MRQTIIFKEWAPDQPDLGAEVLITAKNVIHSASGYKPQKTLDSSMGTATGVSHFAGVFVSGGATKFDSDTYASDGTNFYVRNTSAHFTAKGSVTVGAEIVSFTQYENLIIAVGENSFPRNHTVNSAGNFTMLAASGTAPAASVIDVVGQFVVVGNINPSPGTTASALPAAIQWSGIDNPTSWPTPNSATAIAQQSGRQIMDNRWGQVTGIHGGDQRAIVFQMGAVTRMTYVGPPAVFQFDLISNDAGLVYRRAAAQVGALSYFLSRDGFCRTDGVSIERIGVGKVDKFFNDTKTGIEQYITCAYDPLNHLVCWAFPTSASTAGSTATGMLNFCIDTNQWTYSDVVLDSLITPGHGNPGIAANTALMAFGTNGIAGLFAGTAGSAVFETSDAEFNPGGRSWVSGIKPNVESSGTAPAMTARIGYRDSLGSTPTYTSQTSANSSNGFCDFRVDAKYVRSEFTITGNFEKVTGMVADVQPSSGR